MAAWLGRFPRVLPPAVALGFRLDEMADLPATPHLRPWTRTTLTWTTYPSASPLGYERFHHSSGILTGCPSLTPFGLSLGPTDPEPTNVAQGTLRFLAGKILTFLIATYSSILTSHRSSTPYGMPSLQMGTLPYHYTELAFCTILDCGVALSPV